MPGYQAFLSGLAGAFVAYALFYRETRFEEFLKSPARKWHVLAFDLGVYLLCGGLVTMFLVEPRTTKEAFIGGLAWQSIAGGIAAGREWRALRKQPK